MEDTIEAAYEAIIPAFKNFEVANAAKVAIAMYICTYVHMYIQQHDFLAL